MKNHSLLLLLICWMQCLGLFATELENLKVEYATCPMGIDVSTPRFSWQMKAGENEYGIRQNAYQIWVYDEQGTCVWDSKKIAADRSRNIEYARANFLQDTRFPIFSLSRSKLPLFPFRITVFYINIYHIKIQKARTIIAAFFPNVRAEFCARRKRTRKTAFFSANGL